MFSFTLQGRFADFRKASITLRKAELAEGTMRGKGLRGEIVEGKAQVVDTLKKVSQAEEAIAAAEKGAADEEEEREGILTAKIKQLQSLEVCFGLVFRRSSLTILRSR